MIYIPLNKTLTFKAVLPEDTNKYCKGCVFEHEDIDCDEFNYRGEDREDGNHVIFKAEKDLGSDNKEGQ